MLRVKTTVKKSTIPGAGLGLFTEEFIPKDTIIWEFTPNIDRVYTEEEYNQIWGKDRDFLNTYCYKYNGKYYLCVDNGRFFNHSENPNCYSSDHDENNLGYTRALRDIEVGEELTDNYALMGLTEEDRKYNTI